MISKKKNTNQKLLLGIIIAVVSLAVGSATFVNLQGQVGGFNCNSRPQYTGSWFQNDNNLDRYDVDNNGKVNQKDAQIVLDMLKQKGSGKILKWRPGFVPPPFIDVNGDQNLTTNDAILVINYVNNCVTKGEGEGERKGNRWHNAAQPKDVNGDGFAGTPTDVRVIVNELNSNGPHLLDPARGGPPYLDVNNNGALDAGDYQTVGSR